ncbi:CEP76 C2 domain-containing protein [Pelagophyceae sp. CCMP2097]|nr:CEP76 C2 domain-containing protein [Pelagophyceae sp. CCMP2097]
MSNLVENERRIDELRMMIDGVLSETDAYSKIKEALQSKAHGQGLDQRVSERRMLAQLVSAVKQAPVPELLSGEDGEVGVVNGSALALRVEIRGGAAFMGELVDEGMSGEANAVRAHLSFRRQRGATGPAAAAVEPKLRGVFLFRLCATAPRTVGEWHDLVDGEGGGSALLRLCVTRERVGSAAAAKRELVATASVDWRQALLNGGGLVSVPLKGAGPDSVLAEAAGAGDDGAARAGAVLRLALDVVALDAEGDGPLQTPFDDVAVRRAVGCAATRHAEASRRFYLYAKTWWGEYSALDTTFGDRAVKLFARDEAGDLRCACSFVSPLRAARALDSPRHAARFVSLLPLEKHASVGGGAATDIWHTPLAVVSRRAGDVADHATLLCSLLLGFGLDAYVAVGSMPDGRGRAQAHVWCITVNGPAASGRPKRARVVAWESATAKRCALAPLDAEAARRYLTVACVFNHERFLANRQPSELVTNVSFDLEDAEAWKPLDEGHIAALLQSSNCASPCVDFALSPTRLDVPAAELALESQLRSLVSAQRHAELGLVTAWDADLSYMLQPALAAYEGERVLATPQNDDDFQDAIRRRVPQGHCFKGFPTCFSHANAPRIFAALQRGELSQDVLTTAGEQVRHALRVRIFAYAEDVVAVWVMIAVRYAKPRGPAPNDGR